MAQWTGQYTGRTHETKVARIEYTMKTAVESLRAASKDEHGVKYDAVVKVAERLLTARLKMLGARIERLTEARSPDQYPSQTTRLIEREAATIDGGIDAILAEFGITPKIRPNNEEAEQGGDGDAEEAV